MTPTLYVLAILTAALAWALARRSPDQRPLAWAFTISVVANATRHVLAKYILAPPGVVVTGSLAWWERLDRALFLAWRACIVAIALTVLARRSAIGAVIAYIFAAGVAAALYPELRGEQLRKFYLFCELAACAVGFVCMYLWARRKELSTSATRIAGIVIVAHFVTTILGAYRFGLYGPEWQITQVANLLTMAIIILLQLGDLWTPRSS